MVQYQKKKCTFLAEKELRIIDIYTDVNKLRHSQSLNKQTYIHTYIHTYITDLLNVRLKITKLNTRTFMPSNTAHKQKKRRCTSVYKSVTGNI